MGINIFIIKDSEELPKSLGVDVDDLKLNGKNPVEDNYCARGAGDEDEDIEEDDYVDEEIKPDTECKRSGNSNIRIGYYVGIVRANYQDGKDDKKDTLLLRSKSRFPQLSVVGMLETVIKDDEISSYLKTGIKGEELKADSLYKLGEEPIILSEVDQVITSDDSQTDKERRKAEIEEILKEYRLIRLCECIRSECMSKKKNGQNLVCFQSDYPDKDGMIRPYAINMALLFELYSRCHVKRNMTDFVNGNDVKMLDYVSDKMEASKGTKETEGAKLICRPEKCDTKFYLQAAVVPDIVLQVKEGNENQYYIYDAKYKDPTGKHDRDDRLQILAYAFMYNAKKIGHIFPAKGKNKYEKQGFDVESEGKIQYEMVYIS